MSQTKTLYVDIFLYWYREASGHFTFLGTFCRNTKLLQLYNALSKPNYLELYFPDNEGQRNHTELSKLASSDLIG